MSKIIEIEFPNDADYHNAVKVFAEKYGYQKEVPSGKNDGKSKPNPLSKESFFEQIIQNMVLGQYRNIRQRAIQQEVTERSNKELENFKLKVKTK